MDAGVGFNTETTEGTVIVGGMGGGILVGSVLKKVNMLVGTSTGLTEHSDERGGNAGGG